MKSFLNLVFRSLRWFTNRVLWGILGGAAVFVLLWMRLEEGATTRDILEISLLLGLFVVTFLYALSTRDIAEETKQLAKSTQALAIESEKQRLDAIRPILDIIHTPEPGELFSMGYSPNQGTVPDGVTCIVKNVGLGPALNVQLDLLIGSETNPEFVPLIAVSNEEKRKLKVHQDLQDSPYIRVSYRDVFGRKLDSKKRLRTDGKLPLLGILQLDIEEK